MLFRIDGVTQKSPKNFNREKYKITKSKRLASGAMDGQLITMKRKILVKYDVISGPDLQKLMDIFDKPKFFYQVQYEYLGKVETLTMYPGAIKYEDFRRDGKWYWKNVSLDWIER